MLHLDSQQQNRGRLETGVSAVIPVYNSEQSLRPLVERLHAALGHWAPDYEIILVNDASRDASWEVIQGLAAESSRVRGICLMRNFGQHNALLCGIRAAGFDTTLTLDDDLQHPPEEAPKLLEKLAEGYDVVYGRPEQHRQGLWRGLATWAIKLGLRAAMGIAIAGEVSAFRAFRTDLRQAFAGYTSPWVVIDVLLTWGASRFGSVVVRHERRPFGRSNYSFGRLVGYVVNMVTGFSALPLRLASFVGVLLSLFGVAVLAWVLGVYAIEGGSPAGFPFLASIIAIFSGAQMLTLGIMGEYLARLHFRSMERPPYVVASLVGAAETADVPELV